MNWRVVVVGSKSEEAEGGREGGGVGGQQQQLQQGHFRFPWARVAGELCCSQGIMVYKTDAGTEPWPHFYATDTEMYKKNDQVGATGNVYSRPTPFGLLRC